MITTIQEQRYWKVTAGYKHDLPMDKPVKVKRQSVLKDQERVIFHQQTEAESHSQTVKQSKKKWFWWGGDSPLEGTGLGFKAFVQQASQEEVRKYFHAQQACGGGGWEKDLDEHVKMFVWTLEKRRTNLYGLQNCLENPKKRYEKNL